MDPLASHAGPRGLAELGDERLAGLAGTGCAAAFEVLHARHRAALLGFCRRLLGNREDGEDAVQQTFARAHRALRAGPPPCALRPWLYAIARNRCLTQIADRATFVETVTEVERGVDRLEEDVERRGRLRELMSDLGRLPADQRSALVLSELGALGHAEIGLAVGCSAGKVRALIFQARANLTAERAARETPCADVLSELATARGGALRRGSLRRHLRLCEPCRAAGPQLARNRPTSAYADGS